MPLFRLVRTADARPPWSAITTGEMTQLARGESIDLSRSDSASYYVVLKGKARVHEDGSEQEASAGDVFAIAPGTVHGFTEAMEDTRLLLLRGPAQPPFRAKYDADGAESLPILTPPSPRRRGASITFDETRTFSPAHLGTELGRDLMLFANLGAMMRAQMEEIRRHCLEEGRLLAGMFLKVGSEQEIQELPLENKAMWALALELRPHAMGVEADIATEDGQQRAEAMRRAWGGHLAVHGVRPAVRVLVRDWTSEELVALFRYLAATPPAELAVALQVTSSQTVKTDRASRAIAAMLPWLHAVECAGTASLEHLESVLEERGYQGWLLYSV